MYSMLCAVTPHASLQADLACASVILRARVQQCVLLHQGVELVSLTACSCHSSVMIAIAPPDKRSHHVNASHGDIYY